MKILFLNTHDIQGGAAKAAYRLLKGLQQSGIKAQMLVQSKASDDFTVIEPQAKWQKGFSKLRPMLDSLPVRLYKHRKKIIFSPAILPDSIAKKVNAINPDIVHLHWIAGGFISIRGISRFARLGRPIVWTLHDMWAFTGGCHYSGECEKYINSCGACPQLKSDKDNDITRKIWRKKRKAYKDLHLTIVTPSRWLAGCAKRSSLLSDSKVEVIPNGLNSSIFRHIDKMTARNILNLPKNKKIILFGAISATTNRLKGFKYLKKAISKLEKMKTFNKDELCLVIFGASHSKDIEKFPFEIKFLGRLYDDFSLALSYSAADVFVGPSLQEAFGQTYTESISCGTPCVAFDYSGPKDIIDHKVNGYLAEYKNSKSLADGIKWILEDENRALKLGEAARRKAVEKYSLEIQAEQYKNLYSSLVKS